MDSHGNRETLPARRRRESLDSDLDHEVREALTSNTQDKVDQKDHVEKAANMHKLQAPGSHTPTQELPQDGLLYLCSTRGQAAGKQLQPAAGKWEMGTAMSVVTQEFGCLGAEVQDGTGRVGWIRNPSGCICKPEPPLTLQWPDFYPMHAELCGLMLTSMGASILFSVFNVLSWQNRELAP